MTSDEISEVVRIVTEAVMSAVDRRLAERTAALRTGTVTQADPLMVRLDGATTPVPVRESPRPTKGSRVSLIRQGTSFTLVDGGTPAVATTSAAGLMSAADKTKLDGIATGANKYTLPAATASTRGGVKVGSGLKISGDVLSVDNGAYVKLLWSGKTTGGVTLNETAANFRFLVVSIGGSDGVVEGSTLVASPNGKTFDVTATFFISGGASIASIRSFRARCTVSGTKLTRGETQQFNGSTVTNGNVYLLSVVGIR